MRPRDYITVKKVLLKKVPCLLVRPSDFSGTLPTLFHYHGWSSSKERHQFLATTIAQYGYQVILPDSNYHGERNPLEDYDFDNLKEHFGNIILQSVEEFQGIREEAQKRYQVDSNRIGVSGSSMGGFITASIFANNRDIQTLISFNGACSWKEAAKMLEKTNLLDNDYRMDQGILEKYEPLNDKEYFYPRPILMLHGDADTSVPINIQRYFYQEVTPLYKKDPERLKLEEYKNMNHHISIRMVESAVAWLEKYL